MKRTILVFVGIAGLFAAPSSRAENSSLKSPSISADALFLGRSSNFSDVVKPDGTLDRNGFDLQEMEIGFLADVDPYSRLNIILSTHPEYKINATTKKVEQEWITEPEEAFVETNQIPATTVRIGEFKGAFGKHNLLHTHAFPFVDAPLVNTALLAGGLSDAGISAAVLLPFSWYSEITAQYLRGKGDNAEFNADSPNAAVGLGHWKNLWDLTDGLTMELGGSFAGGKNSLGGNTSIYGGDLTFKARPVSGGKYHSWIFAGEYMSRKLEQPRSTIEDGAGWDAWGQYQFAQRWSTLARYDYLRVDGSDAAVNPGALANVTTRKYSAALVFNATEFSFYRLEYDQAEGALSTSGDRVERKVYLQANFTIGAHPAHSY